LIRAVAHTTKLSSRITGRAHLNTRNHFDMVYHTLYLLS
jgi:hypothetical protein